MRKANKVIAGVLSALMVLSATPVFAASTGSVASDKTVGEDAAQGKSTSYQQVAPGDYSTDVYLTVDSGNILVGIPTTIILDGKANNEGKNIGKYSVSVEGDIPGDKMLVVEPENKTVSLHQTGKDDITADISQEQTEFVSKDLNENKTVTGEVVAQNLTAGSWNGETGFNIYFDDNVQLYGRKIKTWDVSNDKAAGDDVWMTYYDPSQIVEDVPIEKNITASIKNLFTPMTVYAADDEPGLTDIEQYTDGTIVISGTGASKSNIYYRFFNADKFIPAYEEYCTKRATGIGGGAGVVWINEAYKITDQNYKAISIDEAHQMFSSNEEILKNCLVTNLDTFITRTPDFWKEYASFMPEKVVIKDNVDEIGREAFYACNSIKSVEIGSVDTIGVNAFSGCTSLSELTISEGVTTIGNMAFSGCSLTNIQLPNSLKNINTRAFTGFKGKTITIPGSIESMGEYVFYDCDNLTEVIIEEGAKSIGTGTFSCCDNLVKVTIPSTMTVIGGGAFSTCKKLTDVTLAPGISTIGYGAFRSCSSLKSVSLPKSITAINDLAFSNLSSGSTIYCETQDVADLLEKDGNFEKYTSKNTAIIVDPSMF